MSGGETKHNQNYQNNNEDYIPGAGAGSRLFFTYRCFQDDFRMTFWTDDAPLAARHDSTPFGSIHSVFRRENSILPTKLLISQSDLTSWIMDIFPGVSSLPEFRLCILYWKSDQNAIINSFHSAGLRNEFHQVGER